MDDNGKFVIIDGLRGLAAVSVIIHHGILMTNLFMHADFNALVPRILTQLRSFGVTIFYDYRLFFLTKALTHGIGEAATFYRRRVYRLLPMYLVAVAGGVFTVQRYRFYREHERRLSAAFAGLLAIVWILISGVTLTDGKPSWLILCGVFWTLAVEAKFYLLFRCWRYAPGNACAGCWC